MGDVASGGRGDAVCGRGLRLFGWLGCGARRLELDQRGDDRERWRIDGGQRFVERRLAEFGRRLAGLRRPLRRWPNPGHGR